MTPDNVVSTRMSIWVYVYDTVPDEKLEVIMNLEAKAAVKGAVAFSLTDPERWNQLVKALADDIRKKRQGR